MNKLKEIFDFDSLERGKFFALWLSSLKPWFFFLSNGHFYKWNRISLISVCFFPNFLYVSEVDWLFSITTVLEFEMRRTGGDTGTGNNPPRNFTGRRSEQGDASATKTYEHRTGRHSTNSPHNRSSKFCFLSTYNCVFFLTLGKLILLTDFISAA